MAVDIKLLSVLNYIKWVFTIGITFNKKITLFLSLRDDKNIENSIYQIINKYQSNDIIIVDDEYPMLINSKPTIPFNNVLNDFMSILKCKESDKSNLALDLIKLIWDCRNIIILHDEYGNIEKSWNERF
jgi:hypothetical protein